MGTFDVLRCAFLRWTVFSRCPGWSAALKTMNFAQVLEAAGDRIRVSPDGKYSIDDVMKHVMGGASQGHRCNTYRRVRQQFELRDADRVSFPGPGHTTPVGTADEIDRLLTLLSAIRRPAGRPRSKRVALTPKDALYVMRYSNDDEYVKIGRSRNVEGRRAALEACQNFRVETLVIFPGKGHLESKVHAHFEGCRSTQGAGREWYRIPAGDAAGVVARVLFDLGAA